MSGFKNLTGQRFGRLVVIELAKKKNKKIVWLCKCDCGKFCEIRSNDLRKGHTKSCGCFKKDCTIKRNTKHGMSSMPTFNSWAGMIQRCYNPKNPAYKYYGGRGIKVCERWRNSFENFLEDMGECPEGKSIDRWPDNDGDYEPRNIRYATPLEQRVNSRPRSCGSNKQFWFRAWRKNTMFQFMSNSQTNFAKKHKLNQACISDCLYGNQKTHRGWQFQKIESGFSF